MNTDRNLKLGAVVTHWNGSPIELAVARNAEREAGSNPDARRAQGVEALTLRWLGMSLPPDEDWVTLAYTVDAQRHESRFDWEVIDVADRPELLAGLTDASGQGEALDGLGIDLKTVLLQRARKALFDPQAIQVEDEMAEFREAALAGAAGGAMAAVDPPRADTSFFPDVFPRFGPVDTPSGQFGYIRLKTFAPESRDVSGTVREFARILSLLPPAGLILDVRGNGGGFVNIGERILQMLTPVKIIPEPFHFMATTLTLDIAGSSGGLQPWRAPIAQGIETGASFSQGFPLTSPQSCNDVGQIYQGPVVLITDALCYSTTDIFAAGFQDHRAGTILGIHNNTGAGGANVWDHQQHLQLFQLTPRNPFVPLPQGAGMRVAVRRCTRIGERSGVPLEDLGVVPDQLYFLTRNDVLNHNVDLIAEAALILAGKPRQALRLILDGGAPVRQLRIVAENIDRVDLLVDDRPVLSLDVTTGTHEASLPASFAVGSTFVGNGYRAGELVVSTRQRV